MTLAAKSALRRTDPAGGIVIGALNAELPPGGGIQRYTAELVPELLALDGDALALVASPRMLATHDGRARGAGVERMARGNFAGNLLRLAWHQAALPRFLRGRGNGVFYSTTIDGMIAPVCPQVVTVHDLIPLIHPESGPRLRYHFRYVVPRIVRASAAIIAMSEATRRDLARLYAIPPERVHVVHQGYRAAVFNPGAGERSAAVRARFGLGRYLLATADGRSYKNIPRVLEALARLGREDLQLALVGRTSRKEVDLPALAERLGIGARVRFLGFVSDEELAALYAGAEAFVFPSLYEGFGIPPLEAMACGCPVIVSDRASLPEVCGEAAIYVDPDRVDAIAEAMGRVVAEPALRAGLRERGLERAAQFSYRQAAGEILSVLRGVAADGRGERR